MWFGCQQRRTDGLREFAKAIPKQIDSLFTMINEQCPTLDIYRHILTFGAELTQTPPDLAYLCTIQPEAPAVRRMVTLAGATAADETLAYHDDIGERAIRTGHAQLVHDVERDSEYHAAPTASAASKVRSELGRVCSSVIN